MLIKFQDLNKTSYLASFSLPLSNIWFQDFYGNHLKITLTIFPVIICTVLVIYDEGFFFGKEKNQILSHL